MDNTINFNTSRWTCEMCNTDDTLYDLRELDDYNSSISKTESSSVPYPETKTGSNVPSQISVSILTIDSDCEWFTVPEDSLTYLVMNWSQLYETDLEDLIKYRDVLDDIFIDLPRSIWKYVNDQMFFIHQLERKGTPPATDI
jgi:hypothetical protein